MTSDTVGVVIPSYNDEAFLAQAVQSALDQDHRVRVHIVDDCSTDSTPKIIRHLAAKEPRISFTLKTANEGPASARNTGLRYLENRFIAFLDADDTWYPNKLSVQMMFMQENSAGLVYSSYDVVDRAGSIVSTFRVPTTVSYHSLLKTCPIGTSTVLIDRSRAGDVEMPPLKRAQDYATWLKLLKRGVTAYGVGQPLAQYRLVPGSVSSNKIRKAYYQWHIYRQYEQLGYLESLYYLTHYMVNGLTKYAEKTP